MMKTIYSSKLLVNVRQLHGVTSHKMVLYLGWQHLRRGIENILTQEKEMAAGRENYLMKTFIICTLDLTLA
jgi:hypothetical protein